MKIIDLSFLFFSFFFLLKKMSLMVCLSEGVPNISSVIIPNKTRVSYFCRSRKCTLNAWGQDSRCHILTSCNQKCSKAIIFGHINIERSLLLSKIMDNIIRKTQIKKKKKKKGKNPTRVSKLKKPILVPPSPSFEIFIKQEKMSAKIKS